jgi:hypothetical protein
MNYIYVRHFKTTKFALVFALFESVILSIVVFRITLFSLGLIEAYDWSIPYDKNTLIKQTFYTWNYRVSNSNVELLSILSYWGWLMLLSPSVEIFERLLFFGWVALPAFISFVCAFNLLNSAYRKAISVYVGSLICSLTYALNPFFNLSNAGSVIFVYASLPAIFYFTIKVFQEEAHREALKKAIILSVIVSVLLFPNSIHGIAYGLFLIIFITIVELILYIRRNFYKYLIRAILIISMSTLIPILINAYAVFPYMIYGHSSAFGPQITSGATNPDALKTFSLLPFYALISSFPTIFVSKELSSLWITSCTIIALLAYFSMASLIKKESSTKLNRDIMVILSLLIIISPLLSFIMLTPLGQAYGWLYSNIPYAWGLLKFPRDFTYYTSLGVALFIGFLFAHIYEKTRNSKRVIMGVIIVSIVVLFNVHPMLMSGDYMGILNPSSIPEEYILANEFLHSDHEAFRTLWLPEYGQLKSLPYGHPVSWYTSTVPLLMDRTAVGTDAYNSFRDVRIMFNIDKPDETLFRILGFMSVKYIIYQANTTLSSPELLNNLLSQNDLELVFQKNSIWIFKNKLFQPFIRSPNQNVTLNYVEVNPTKWIVNIKAKTPFILIFAEPYDKNWEAFIGEKKLTKIQMSAPSITIADCESISYFNASAAEGQSSMSLSTDSRNRGCSLQASFTPAKGWLWITYDPPELIDLSNYTILKFWIKADNLVADNGFGIDFFDTKGNFGRWYFTLDKASQWYEVEVPLRKLQNHVDLSKIDRIQISYIRSVKIGLTVMLDNFTAESILPLLNAFQVNETGQFTVTIEYKPQAYMEMGAYVSIATLLLLGIVYFKLSVSTRRKHGKY